SEAAEALLDALPAADQAHKPDLADICHQFIDLARLKSVRAAAYPPDDDGPGKRWLDLILRLIEQSDFTTGRLFRQRAAQYPDKTLFIVPKGRRVTEYTWTTVLQEANNIARGILGVFGAESGASDDVRVALYTPNRIEGALVDLACLTNGIFNTAVPANAVEAHLIHIVRESGARMLVVSGAGQMQNAIAAAERLPDLEWIVTLDPRPHVPGVRTMSLPELVAAGTEVPEHLLDERLARVRSTDLATTMYTSGTTGTPKGIKFTHLNLVSKRFCRAMALPEIDENEVFLCFLPLFHTFGRWLEMMGCVHLAATYVFAENTSTEALLRHMQDFHATALIGVPKKWRDLHTEVTARVGAAEDPDQPERTRRTLAQLTGGRLRWGLSAAGRLDPDIFRFFQRNGIELLSGYGMTEATGGITMTPPQQYVEESIGRALPGIELGFGEDGELLLRGPYVTPGYVNPEDEIGVIQDGWFHTGDIVSRDAAGFLRHVDRKKDIYKNASGNTIAPQRIEALFADFPEISRVFAVGDGRDYVTLLIRPNVEFTEVPFASMTVAARREYFRGLVVSCNRFLAPFERVVRFALLDRDFSADQGELTPKGSFKRATVEQNFRDVIEDLYATTAVERQVDGLRVQVPTAFLQHLGATTTGIRVADDKLEFRAIDKRLRICRDPDVPQRVWVGNCCYHLPGSVLNLDDWLRLPELWVGNAELTHVTGEEILLWSLEAGDRSTKARMIGIEPTDIPTEGWHKRLAGAAEGNPSLLTIHAASVMLNGPDPAAARDAVDHLARVMSAGLIRYVELAESRLQFASNHPHASVRSRAFAAFYEHQPATRFGAIAERFCSSRHSFLDREACRRIVRIGLQPEHWRLLTGALAALRRPAEGQDDDARIRSALFMTDLFRSLCRIAELDWDFFLPVRRELMAWQFAPPIESVGDAATVAAQQLTEHFRAWLGPGRKQAVDPQTGQPYTWAGTLVLEDGIDRDERWRIIDVVQHTELVREAVYVIHRQRRIDLDDLEPGCVWVSLLGTRFGRSIYHIGVRLRSGERCDFALYLRTTAETEKFLRDMRILCIGAEQPGERPLTPQLGGYWPEHRIATVEYVAGESANDLVRHLREYPDPNVRQRLRDAWRHICWSILTAAFEFYRRTERRWVLTSTVTRDVTVPLNDYDTDTRIRSVAGRRPFEGTLNTILRLKRDFVDRARFQYPAQEAEVEETLIFASALEALGQTEGLAFLKQALAEAERIEEPSEELPMLRELLREYVEMVSERGYMPRAVYFAIRRYHAWAKQVPDAAAHTRAAQLRELQNSYRIDEVDRQFPGSRLWLYAQTVLADIAGPERAIIDHAILHLREGADLKEALGRLYAELQHKLPSHDLKYFLTRAAYPHLDLDERAELITAAEAGTDRAELVTQHTDRIGKTVCIRPVASSREVDMLHRIFYTSGMGGGHSALEQLLVVVDDTEQVLGGVGYMQRTPSHVLLNKVAVMHRHRGRGIGRILVKDFIRRQTVDGVQVITAEFIRRDWLGQFGFAASERHAGVVLTLTDAR
ncbi:MAG TPA: GNAT family N-acetyltransferase, partial [Phycisphaerae bacterium]|nr:GNAT family N-acetyltransferase [Phycisphaerae bacterium]